MIPDVNLSSLTAQLNAPGKVEPKELATKVQAMFMEVMLKAMEESVEAEEGLFGKSASAEIYRGMFREQLASAISGQVKGSLESDLKKAVESELPAEGAVSSRQGSISGDRHYHAGELPVDGVVTSRQGWRQDPINGEKRYHAGTDIAAPEGTPVRAVAEGRVIESGSKGGYGNTVVIEATDGRKMLYAHNNQNFVRVGDWVSRGDAIAEVGSTGRATGPHVHFEVKF
jgi:murein DD-endopeptidase MepM/ murein hydrolase activator NlpD